ncbi:MAG: DUF4132 domain-containing protein, partial [bacterium]|nr:DUF4132 domain-containing protein [bacterium]
TKSIQKEAQSCLNKLAQSQGWSVAQLADRTIPTAGFDHSRKMLLDYGCRSFVCQLGDDFKISVSNEKDALLKSLPNAGKKDDPDLVKAAKKDFSNAKKMIKKVVKLQTERLYECMCVEREWPFSDLRNYFFNHPIVSRTCQRLVWVVMENGSPTLSFRPLDDGSLSDNEDNEIKVDDSSMVQLAHSFNTATESANAWNHHFKDFELKPLFNQFPKEIFTLEPGQKELTELSQFQGWMLDSFKLRSLATKRGYSRGKIEMGGQIYEYYKSFPTRNIEAVITFSGSSFPMESTRVALLALSFRETAPDIEGFPFRNIPAPLTLDQVPPVLLSECRSHLKQIAMSGSGFDSNWNKSQR